MIGMGADVPGEKDTVGRGSRGASDEAMPEARKLHEAWPYQ